MSDMSKKLQKQAALTGLPVNPKCLLFSRGVSSTEFGDLETLCKAVVKEKQPFERLEISKETLLKMFKVKE